MKVVILAAGTSSRLRPFTDETPKSLLMVAGKRILDRTLTNLLANGLTDIIIVTGYREQQIRDFVRSAYPALNVQFITNPVYDKTNAIYSLGLAAEAVGNNPMMLFDADVVFDHRIIADLIASGYENCLAMKKHDVQDEEVKIKVDERGRVIEISKEVRLDETLGESIGIELFGNRMREELFRVIHRMVTVDGKQHLLYEAAFQELVDNGFDFYPVDTKDYFCMEIDTPEDLQLAGELMAGQPVSSN